LAARNTALNQGRLDESRLYLQTARRELEIVKINGRGRAFCVEPRTAAVAANSFSEGQGHFAVFPLSFSSPGNVILLAASGTGPLCQESPVKHLETFLQVVEAIIQMVARIVQLVKPVILEILLLVVLVIEAVRFLISVIGG
jgi:hypothetical protein